MTHHRPSTGSSADASTWLASATSARYCAHCYSAERLHDQATMACPQPYRPATLAEAMRELMAAQAAHDQGRIFIARGEIQRLGGNPDV